MPKRKFFSRNPVQILALGLIALVFFSPSTIAQVTEYKSQQIEIQTNLGNIVIQLNAEKAPKTVANFMRYVNAKGYDNTIFHRVIKDFMIQGGGFKSDFSKTPMYEPITNEADNGLKNLRGTIAMARTRDPHSATNQFFINTLDNTSLDYRSKTISGWGYTVFGKVISGTEVIDKIRAITTGSAGPFSSDVPTNTIMIFQVIPYPPAEKSKPQ